MNPSPFSSKELTQMRLKDRVLNLLKTNALRNIIEHTFRLCFFIISLLPKKNNLIIFESFLGKQYSDSPRAIYEYILENDLKYEMYWSIDRRYIGYFNKLSVKHIRRFSIKWFFLMPRAKYWITNSRLPLWIPKSKNTIYIQTWHGTPLKRLAADMNEVHMPGTSTKKYKDEFLQEAKKWDYLISPNAYSTEIFRRAFSFEKEIIESGYPRNDYLIKQNNEEVIRKLKKSMNIPIEKKVILYAPTWRDNQYHSKGNYKFNLELDLERLRDALGSQYVIILRLHYLVSEKLDLRDFHGFVYNLSHHEDIRELYLVSDMLITDYSSVFFDYANLKRPMLFFVYDLEEYRDKLRGFYFDLESNAPGPLVTNTNEIIEYILEIEQNGYNYTEKMEAFYKKFCYLEDGKASERVVSEVFENHVE